MNVVLATTMGFAQERVAAMEGVVEQLHPVLFHVTDTDTSSSKRPNTRT